LPHYLVLGAAAVALATAYDELGLWGVAVFAIPVLAIRYALQQYTQRSADGVHKLTRAADQVKALEMDARVRRLALQGVADALDRHNGDGAKHRQRVVELCRMVSGPLGIRHNTREWLALEQAALLHDLGTVSLDAELFQKPGPLTGDEWALIRRHPAEAHDILTKSGGLRDVADILLAHHERFDGTGYPRGVAAEEIPLGARILAVAEALEAMTGGRPYRPSMLAEEALLELERNRGSQFDPWVVDGFLANVRGARPLQRVQH
jgi:HD-GYP domain-containing protein (c-di-GMP phosphodiesterase class II)